MKDIISGILISLFIGFSIGLGVDSNRSSKERETLTAENERLRLFNAREVRRMSHPPPKVNKQAVELATHLQGIPSSVVAALYYAENGPPDIETGILGKTELIAKNYPLEYWPALEAGRTLNHYAWSWFLNTPEGKQNLQKMLFYAGKPYTAGNPKNVTTWANTIIAREKEISSRENGEAKSLSKVAR